MRASEGAMTVGTVRRPQGARLCCERGVAKVQKWAELYFARRPGNRALVSHEEGAMA